MAKHFSQGFSGAANCAQRCWTTCSQLVLVYLLFEALDIFREVPRK